MVKQNELAVLEVNGKRYQDWETVTVVHQMQAAPWFSYRFTCSEGMPIAKNFAVLRIKPGDKCQVTLAGQPAVLGLVHTRQVFYDAKRHFIEIQGASIAAGVAYAGASTKGSEFKDQTWEQMARKMLTKFKPPINLKIEGGQLPQIKFPRISIAHGQTVLEVLEIPLRSLGHFPLTSNPQGDLVVHAGQAGGGDVLVEGKNILEGREVIFHNGIHSQRVHASQDRGTNDKHGAKVTHDKTNTFLKENFSGMGAISNFFSPTIIPMLIPNSDKKQLEGHDKMEDGMQNGERVTIFCTVHGWLKPSGGLWKIREKVKVKSPMLLMNGSEDLTLHTATFTQDNERGSRTQLELRNPAAMSGIVPGKDAAGGGEQQTPGGFAGSPEGTAEGTVPPGG